MSLNDADTLFDRLADPEVLGVMNGGTIWVASPDDRALLSDVSYLLFLKCQIFESPILEVTSLCRIHGTAPAPYFGAFAGLECLFNPR